MFQLGCVDFLFLSLVPPVIPREARNLKSVNGVCATILDSSLRSASFRMTGKGSYVRNDRISKPSLFKLCIPLSVHRGGRDIAPPKGGVTGCFGGRFDLPRCEWRVRRFPLSSRASAPGRFRRLA